MEENANSIKLSEEQINKLEISEEKDILRTFLSNINQLLGINKQQLNTI
jgi:hypothetical protein